MIDDRDVARAWTVVRSSDDLGVSEVSSSLKGRRIGLAIGGGIAAIEAPRIARSLRRLGAEVQAYATEQALSFVGEKSLEWATTNPVVTSPSGLAEHVSHHDGLIVACATADLIAKAALGICSDGVSTLIQSALGNATPLIFAPTMHNSLAAAPAVRRNLEALIEHANVVVLQSREEEAKQKSREPYEVADEVSHAVHRLGMGTSRDSQHRALVTYGGTRVPIDAVRSLTNRSTGALGQAVIAELYRWGYKLDVLRGDTSVACPPLDGVEYFDCTTYHCMRDVFLGRDPKSYRGIFMLAAISDFASSEEPTEQKIPSSATQLDLSFTRAEKLVASPLFKQFLFRFACKLTKDTSETARADLRRLADSSAAHFIYWNTVDEAFGNKLHCGRIWRTGTAIEDSLLCTSKNAVARLAVELFRHSDLKELSSLGNHQ